NLHRAGVDPRDIEVIFLSHFHADHSFGWPFLLLTWLTNLPRTTPLAVVGPPGTEAFLENMVRAGALQHLVEARRAAGAGFPVTFVEVSEADQTAGGVPFSAVRVEHDPALDCYGYVLTIGDRTIGYSGDTRLCDGLRRIAVASDALVLECNQMHGNPAIHMSVERVRSLREEFPNLPFVLTHMGQDVDAAGVPLVREPGDLETVLL
ncbi:MAG: MBL fold metallo-hydrolase, partial [Dehalococcoidia bacterium]